MHTVGVDLGGTNIDCTDAKGVFSGSVDLGGVFVAELIDGCISALAVGIASAVNLFGLEGVVPCGGMGDKLGEQFCALSEAAMQPHLFFSSAKVKLVSAALGDSGGAIGPRRRL